jgi:hypothetical protein
MRGGSNLKAITYLVGGFFIAPGAMLAYGFWTLTEAIRQDDVFKMLFFLLVRALQVLEWSGWFIVGGGIVWLVLAFLPKFRLVGAVSMAVMATASLVELFVVTGVPKEAGEFFIPALSLAGLLINLWLVWDSATSSWTVKRWSEQSGTDHG